ncbi:MAG: hypothetical protein ACKVKF_18835 [Rhodobacterales bacterium]
MPDVNLHHYRCRAVFDWMEVAIDLPKKMLTLNVGRALKTALSDPGLGGVMVTDRARKTGEPTDQMLIRLQDPSLQRFKKLFEVIERRYHVPSAGPTMQHRVVGLELSVDFYPRPSKIKDEDDRILRRIQMSELLRKHFAPDELFISGDFSHTRDWLRYSDGMTYRQISAVPGPAAKALREVPKLLLASSDPKGHAPAPINATVYVGEKERELHYRLQDKTGNMRQKSEFRALPPQERRSRIEYTLFNKGWKGETLAEQLGIYTVSDISGFQFQNNRTSLLTFELPVFSVDKTGAPALEEIEIFKKTGCVGLKLFHIGRQEIERAKDIRDEMGRLPNPTCWRCPKPPM